MKNNLEFSTEAKNLRMGTYEHYKGNKYKVIGVGRHSETLEELVIYQAQYGDFGIWVRPVKMFVEAVTVERKQVPRFKLINND